MTSTRVLCLSEPRSQVDLRKLKRNGVIVAEALARFMYRLSEKVTIEFDYHPSTETIVIF